MFRQFLGMLVSVGVLATLMPSAKVEALSVLTLTDTFGGTNTVWALSVTTGCTDCTVSLTADFQDPDGAGGRGSTPIRGGISTRCSGRLANPTWIPPPST